MPPTVVGTFISREATEELLAAQRPTSDATYLQQGGGVSLVSGLTFRVSAGQAFIRGVLYTFPQADITLGAADGSNPRIDLIVADSATGTFHAVAGTAAANPAQPDIDPLTQLVVTFVSVAAAATTIPTIVKTDFYHEATEATLTTSAGGRIVTNSTSQPLAGTKCIEGTACVADDWVMMTLASAVLVASANQLVLNIKSKASWASQKALQLQWQLGTAKVGQVVSIADKFFGFVSSQVTTYQQIVIPIGNFKMPSGTAADRLEIRVKGAGGSIGFRLDDIVLESSGVISVVGSYSPAEVDAIADAAASEGELANFLSGRFW